VNINGFTTGQAHRHGRLSLTPLYAPDVEVGFVGDVHLADDANYGRMGFGTDHPGGGVAPFGWAAFIDGGQDRALREALFVRPGKVEYGETVCLEPEQGGLWREGVKQAVFTLPLSLQAALPAGGGYSALWAGIKRRHEVLGQEGTTVKALLNGPASIGGTALPVALGARGVAVALDGRLVAVEIAPTASAFAEWWADFGLSDAVAFEAATMPTLPLPLSDGLGDEQIINVPADGIQQVTWFDLLKGWVFVQNGLVVYASVVDGEAMVMFDQAQAQDQAPIEFPCDQYVEWEGQ
jgi:hypothetical protein